MDTLTRFLKFIIKEPSGCWTFNGARAGKDGHRAFKLNGKQTYAHRTAYTLMVGEIPEGLMVRHKCDNPSCVNPDHLELGTHQDNMDDKAKRYPGRTPSGHKGLYPNGKGWRGLLTKHGKKYHFRSHDKQAVIDWLTTTRAKLYNL